MTRLVVNTSVLLWLSGCTQLIDAGRTQCSVDADCSMDRTGLADLTCMSGICARPPGPGWGCLENPAPEPASGTVELQVDFFDEITDLPAAGATLNICSADDPTCAAPKATLVTDAEGAASFTMARTDYLEVVADGFRNSLIHGVDGMDYLVAGPPYELGQGLLTDAAYMMNATNAGISLTAGTGDLIASTFNCDTENAAGVRFELDGPGPGTAVAYVANDMLSTLVSQTDDQSSTAFYFNVPPGMPNLSGHVVDEGRDVDTARPIIVREGWVTNVAVLPRNIHVDTHGTPES